MSSANEKISRGNAGQFRVASELCRRGMQAAITLGNTPGVDVLCMGEDRRKCVLIQVKTFRAGANKCAVGKNAEIDMGDLFFWVLAGLRDETHPDVAECFYIVPSRVMAKHVSRSHKRWLSKPGKKGQKHKDNNMRTVCFNTKKGAYRFDINEYENRWDLIEEKLESKKTVRKRPLNQLV